jgi:two-component sensor histidine kinase
MPDRELKNPSGTIRNPSHDADGQLHLRWTESSGPKVQQPTHKGFGGRIIEQMIAQRSGKMHFGWQAEGLVCEITLQV